jgi:hypothetical protein
MWWKGVSHPSPPDFFCVPAILKDTPARRSTLSVGGGGR